MPIRTPDGYLDITNATLRGSEIITTSKVGIANSAPTHTLSVGNKLFVDDSAANVLTVTGNLVATSLKIGQIDLAPSYALEHVANVGNTISNVVQFTNTGTGFVSASNVGIGTTTSPAGLFDVVGAFRMRYQDMGVTKAHIITGANSTSITESGGTYTYTRGGSGNTGNFLPNPSNIVPKVGQRYRVKLTARSDYAGTIRYECPTSTIITTYDLTTTFKEYTWDFTATGTTMQFAVTTASGTTSQFNAFSIERLGVGFNVNPTSTAAPVQISGVTHFSDNVGIGTASPESALDISSTSGLMLRNTSNKTGVDDRIGYIEFYNGETGGGNRMSSAIEACVNAGGLNNNSDLRFKTTLDYNNPLIERMRIDRRGNVGIGTNNPIAKLDIDGGAENNTTPALAIRGGLFDPSDLYVLNSYSVTSGVGYAAKVIGVNIKNKVETDNTVQIRNNVGGLISAGAIYFGSDNVNQGIFGVLGGTGNVGTTLAEYLTVRDDGNVGIGTASPLEKLDVYGTSRISSAYPRLDFFCTTGRSTNAWGNSTGAAGDYRIYSNGDASDGTKRSLNFDYGQNTTHTTRMCINADGNVGIGTASPRGMLDVYTGNTSVAGLIIDRYSSGTYRSELYQESDGLAIKVGDGSNAPAENMRITRTTTATPGKLTVGTSTASTSQMFVYAAGNGSSTAHTDLHVMPNGRLYMYGTRPWQTLTNGQGTLDKTCSLTLITSDHTPAIEWTRNNAQGTNQRNWLLRQENDIQLNLWEYNGSTWAVPVAFNKDYLLTGVNQYLAFHYSTGIKVSPQNAASWPSGTTNLISVNYANNQDTVNIYTPGGGRSLPLMTLKHLGRVGIDASSGFTSGPEPRAKFHIGEYIPNNSGTNNTIPSSNAGQATVFPTSTKIWMANRATTTEEDYWGCAMGVIWDGHTYIQSVNKKTSAVYSILLNPNGGNVGVGTATPYAKLHVNGTGDVNIGASERQYFRHGYNSGFGATTTSSGYGWGNSSIYASHSIVSGDFFMSISGAINSSDVRIKKNIVDADDAECLEVLRLLKPKKYQYKDEIKSGTEPVWGFIAQEVRETLPYATKTRQFVLPNIYELANVSSSNVITFTNFNTSNLESNATTLIRTKGIDGEDHDIHLAEVIDAHSIRVEEDMTEWTGSVDETGNVVAGNQLFVYGQEVDDFVFLKKEAIWTVATAALQEVDRQLQVEKTKTTTLETKTTTLDTELQEAEAKTTALETKLQEAEAKITTLQAEKEAIRSDLSSLVLRVAALES